MSLLEVQKLAYFLQEAGEPLRLEYVAHHYGPYADNLRKSLRNMEGHYTRGVGDGNNSPETPLEMLPAPSEPVPVYVGGTSEAALRRANAKFVRRFKVIETELAARGKRPEEETITS